jgi:hypothetical protein
MLWRQDRLFCVESSIPLSYCTSRDEHSWGAVYVACSSGTQFGLVDSVRSACLQPNQSFCPDRRPHTYVSPPIPPSGCSFIAFNDIWYGRLYKYYFLHFFPLLLSRLANIKFLSAVPPWITFYFLITYNFWYLFAIFSFYLFIYLLRMRTV